MVPTATHDELAGVVGLFGALTREELERALRELAFKQGREIDDAAVDEAIDDALDAYALVETDGEAPLLVVGPTAFPTLPSEADDLPHIMDVPERSVDREELAPTVHDRLLAEAEDAADERVATLREASYDLEAWASIDAGDVRERLEGEEETL